MIDSDEIKLKNEINGIVVRIKKIMTIIEEFDPAKNEESIEDENQATMIEKV